MAKSFWALIAPFKRDLTIYISGTVVRQILLIVGGYSLVWLLRAATAHAEISPWIFIAALVIYDAVQLSLDMGFNQHLAQRVSYPLFGRLRCLALRKVFRMPLEWH